MGCNGIDELAIDVAAEKIGRRNRHDRRGHQRADTDGGEGEADEPGREHLQEQGRHRKIGAELFEGVCIGRHFVDADRERHEAQQRDQSSRNE